MIGNRIGDRRLVAVKAAEVESILETASQAFKDAVVSDRSIDEFDRWMFGYALDLRRQQIVDDANFRRAVGEMYANYFFLRYKLPIVKTRFQNIYGPREILGAGQWRGTIHTVWRNVIPTFIWKALHKEALPLENGGKASRDFVYVEDLVEGLYRAALRGEPGEVYNLASGRQTMIHDLARLINQLSGNDTSVEGKPARSWDRSGLRFGSTEKSKRVLGFEATTSIRDGLAKTIAWTKENRDLIGRCIARHNYFLAHPRTGHPCSLGRESEKPLE